MKFKIQSLKFKVVLLLATYFLAFTTFCGCEAFRKKFVRKSKRRKEVKVVIETQEYESKLSVEETYKKYYLFWRASHDELVNSLNSQDGNRKKLLSSARKIIENLKQMRGLLLPAAQSNLDIFISEQKKILSKLEKYNLSRARGLRIKSALEKQRRQIQRVFNYRHIQQYLIQE